jgi:hypothetical protein
MQVLKVLLVVVALATFAPSTFGEQKTNLTDIGNMFEKKILEHVQKNEFRKAIIVAAEYEQELLSRYHPPIFQIDLFQSEADYLSFHNSFTDWQQADMKELQIHEWLPMMGLNPLLALQGKGEDDRLFVHSMNFGQLERRMGMGEPGKTELTDQKLLLAATMMSGNFGVVKSHEFKTIGDHRGLVLHLGTPAGGAPMLSVHLPHDGRLYAFLLASSLSKRQEHEQRLFELIKTVSFHYKPADAVQIGAMRDKFKGRDDPSSLLQVVRQLSTVGEYNAAAEELARLRLLVSQLMPKPAVSGNVARYPAYGVSLANPDEKKWKLSIQGTGATTMLLLEDKWSVKQEGLGIFVLDTILAYGPGATKALEDEALAKQLLIGAGRGAALSLGTAIQEERFTTVKGQVAYEALVDTNIPGGVKAKVLCLRRSGFMLASVMLADAQAFQKKIEEYEKILQGDGLQIGPE